MDSMSLIGAKGITRDSESISVEQSLAHLVRPAFLNANAKKLRHRTQIPVMKLVVVCSENHLLCGWFRRASSVV